MYDLGDTWFLGKRVHGDGAEKGCGGDEILGYNRADMWGSERSPKCALHARRNYNLAWFMLEKAS